MIAMPATVTVLAGAISLSAKLALAFENVTTSLPSTPLDVIPVTAAVWSAS